MKKMLYLLLTVVIVYIVFRLTANSKEKSPLRKRIAETLNIVVWIILLGYILGFLYWLYTALFS